jgi:hypothetical protein
MSVYRGERTDEGCVVTVDRVPLPARSDLSGATAPFDWGYVGNGQLSLALLAHLLGDGQKAKALCAAFERAVVASLPHDGWTATDDQLAAAVRALAGTDAAAAAEAAGDSGNPSADAGSQAFGDMPVRTGSSVLGDRAEDPTG